MNHAPTILNPERKFSHEVLQWPPVCTSDLPFHSEPARSVWDSSKLTVSKPVDGSDN